MPLARGCKIPVLACRVTYMSFGTKFSVLTAAVLVLAACGGSGGLSGSTGVRVSPSGIQVLAGFTQQMTATASDGGTIFTWQVNGTTGGNATVGTISSSGLYTAPGLPPSGGTVTIGAIEQGMSGATGSATLNIGYSNASLQNGYVFTLSGSNQAVPWFAIGEFTANGSGQIGSGLQDVNNGTAIQTKAAFTGSYSINPDGSGQLAFGNLTFALSMQANGGAFLVSTSNGTVLTGSLSIQDPAAGGVAALNAPMVLNAGGQTGTQGFDQLALISTASATSISGFEDVSGSKPLSRAAYTGSYAFDGNNHGSLSIKDTNGSHAYSFYVASASDIVLLSTDPAVTASGNVSAQTGGTYASASLNGPFVFLINGNSATQSYVQAGQFNPNGLGGLGMVTTDINMPGNTLTALSITGTYTFDTGVNGRGTLTLGNPGIAAPQNFVFYMLAPQLAEFITTNSTIAAGGYIVMQTQGNTFNNSSLDGAYGFALGGLTTGTTNQSAALGTLTLDGNGNLSGQMLQNLNGSASSLLSLGGNYALNGNRGTATITSSGGGSSPFAIYPINSGEFLLIGTNAASPYFGIATNQN